MIRDERAITNSLFLFFGTLAIGGLLYFVVGDLGQDIVSWQSQYATSSAATRGQQYQLWTWQSLWFIIPLLGFIQLLTAAVYQGVIGR